MRLNGINHKRQFKLAGLLILLPIPIVAQNGPGGIGSKDGNSDLELWLRADTGVKTSNGNVGHWADSSGNKNHAKPPTKNDSPSYSSNGLNGQPTIGFEKTNKEFLDLGNAVSTGSKGGVTIFIVFKPEGTIDQISSERTILANDGSNSNTGFLALGDALGGSSGERLTFGRNTSSSTEGYFYSNNINSDFRIHHFTFDGNNAIYFQDNSSETLNAHNSGFSNSSLKDLKRIGGNANDAAYFDGEVAEIIIYSRTLSESEINIVANYIDAKYQLGELQSEDYFSNSGSYKNELIGVGSDSNGSNLFATKGGMALDHSHNTLSKGDYFCLAHNGSSGILSYGGGNERWARAWKLDGLRPSTDASQIKFIYCFEDYDVNVNPLTGSADDYIVTESSDGSFSNPKIVKNTNKAKTTLYQDSIVFDLNYNDLKLGNFYTIATTDPDNSPLPVELINFKAVKRQHSVKLQWETASETNNHYFQVQRKTNGQWENVGKVEGHGTTTKAQAYHHFDKNPEFGQNYYRLKQVDYNRSIDYSPIQAIKWKEDSTPATDSIALKGNIFKTKLQVSFRNIREGTYEYQLADIQGKIIQKGKWQISATGATKKIDISPKQKGIYILRVAGNNAHYTEKVMKD